MAEGRIYACYETPEELEIKRKRAMAKGLAPVYDRQALHYTAEDLAKFKAEGRKPHYRFKLLDGVIEWDDIVHNGVGCLAGCILCTCFLYRGRNEGDGTQ